MSRIIPHLWYSDKAEEAAAFYASVLPNSKVDSVTALPADSANVIDTTFVCENPDCDAFGERVEP